MKQFDFFMPMHLKFGEDIVNKIGTIASSYGDKALIIVDSKLKNTAQMQALVDILDKSDCKAIVFEGVISNADTKTVALGAELAKSSYSNVVIGFGGIRTMSIAKAIAMLATNSGIIEDYIDGKKQEKESLPYIELPSVPCDPLMFRDEFLITDARKNIPHVITLKPGSTKYVIFDSNFISSLPHRYIVSTIVSLFANSFDGYVSKKSSYFVDFMFLKGFEFFNKRISTLTEENAPDKESQNDFYLSGLFASIGLSVTGGGIISVLSYVINSKYKIPKSFINAILLPYVMEFVVPAVPEKFTKIYEALGGNPANMETADIALKTIEIIRKILVSLKLPLKLSNFNLIKQNELASIADIAKKFEVINLTPRICTSDDLYSILEKAF